MKKVIAIVAVVVVALVGLTSYNGNDVKKGSGDDGLFAQVKTKAGEPIKIGTKKAD